MSIAVSSRHDRKDRSRPCRQEACSRCSGCRRRREASQPETAALRANAGVRRLGLLHMDRNSLGPRLSSSSVARIIDQPVVEFLSAPRRDYATSDMHRRTGKICIDPAFTGRVGWGAV